MKKPLLPFLSVAALFLLGGCETIQTPQQRRSDAVRQQALLRSADEKIHRLRGRVEALEAENARLVDETQRLKRAQQSLEGRVAALEGSLADLAARQKKQSEELIRRVEKLLKKAAAAPRASAGTPRGPGRIHVVEAGHTLSAIAKAYGTTVEAIKKANHLKSDKIYVGQKLFIPEN